MAAFQEELQVLVIFEACGENRSGNVLRDNSRNDAPRAFPSTGAVRSGEESRAEPEILHTTITEEAEALYASHIEAEDFVL